MSNQRIKYNNETEFIISRWGDIFYYKMGTKILHRLDGPARDYRNGDKEWFQNNKRHRTDGPAVEYENGEHKEYYIHGEYIIFSGTDEEWIIKNLLE